MIRFVVSLEVKCDFFWARCILSLNGWHFVIAKMCFGAMHYDYGKALNPLKLGLGKEAD